MQNKQFEKMVGKTYLYANVNHLIQRVEHAEDDLYDVYTDKKRFRVSASEIRKDFLPVHVPAKAADTGAYLEVFKEQAKPMNDLASKLDNMIENIENGKLDIKKAKAINETVRSIIGVRKTAIELLKVLKK